MKKILVFLVFFAILLTVSCGEKKESESETNDSDGNTAESESPDYDEDAQEEELKCTGLSVDWKTFKQVNIIIFEADASLGDPSLDDKLRITFHEDKDGRFGFLPGTYDLGAYPNTNYSSCIECVLLFQDYVEYADPDENSPKGYYKKTFFQKSGTLDIDEDLYQNIAGTISAKFVEVTIDPDTDVSTVVDGGECYEIESGSFDSGLCQPDCTGKVCGSNGCRGTCGSCGDLACSADQTQCVPYKCEIIDEIGEFTKDYHEFSSFPYSYKADIAGSVLGDASSEGLLAINFRKDSSISADSVSLVSHVGLCDQCIYLYEDLESDGGKTYFQQSGELVFEKVDEETFDSQGHGSVRLVEYDMKNYFPLSGGKCYEIPNLTWDTFCHPECTGKICGSNGCGGICGEGCGKDEYCNAEQTECLPYENCTKITLAEEYEYFDYNYDYDTTYTPNTGDPEIEDLFRIDIRIPIPPENLETQYSASEFDLYGSDYGDSDVRILVYEDRGEDGAKTYFQQKGRIAFRTKEDLISHDIEVTATIEDLRLVESVVGEDPINPEAVPVVGGSCLELNDTTIGYTIEN